MCAEMMYPPVGAFLGQARLNVTVESMMPAGVGAYEFHENLDADTALFGSNSRLLISA